MKKLLENTFAVFVVPVISYLTTAIAWLFGSSAQVLLGILVAQSFGILTATLAFYLWLHNHRKRRAHQTLGMVKAIIGPDRIVTFWRRRMLANNSRLEPAERLIVPLNADATADELREAITELLEKLSSLLAYRIHSDLKGATFLLLMDETEGASFGLFARWHHPSDDLPMEIGETLRLHTSLAGQAVKQKRAIILENCTDPPPGIQFVSNNPEPTYLGRSAFRVTGTAFENTVTFGALCIDIDRPWGINKEEQKLVAVFCTRIAHLCATWMEMTGDLEAQSVLRSKVLVTKHL